MFQNGNTFTWMAASGGLQQWYLQGIVIMILNGGIKL